MRKNGQKKSKKQIAYDFILSKVVNGHYGPGYRLIIDQIAKEVGSSIIPVREAMRQLEADGVVKYEPYVGAVVNSMDKNEYIETMATLAVLDGYGTSLALENMTSEDFDELERINNEMKECLTTFDFNKFSELNRMFHMYIVERSNNQYLIDTVNNTWKRIERVRNSGLVFPKRAPESIVEHQKIIDMLRSKESPEKIDKYAREHKLNTIKILSQEE